MAVTEITNKELLRYRYHRAQVGILQEKINKASVFTHDVVKSGKPGGVLVIQGIAYTAQMRQWEAEQEAHLIHCIEVEEYIASIDDPITRRAFELRFMEGEKKLYWDEVAAHIGGGNTEDGIKKRFQRELQKMSHLSQNDVL